MSGKRIRGARDLLFESVEVVADLVEKTQDEVTERWTERAAWVEPVAPIARGVRSIQKASSSMTFTTIRLVTRGVGAITRAVTDPMLDDEEGPGAPMTQAAQGSGSWWADQLQGTLNGVVGDHLARASSGLDFGMTLRRDGEPIPVTKEALAEAFPNATSKVVVFVHGLATTEWSWVLYADRFWGDPTTCYGTLLASALGFTPIYVRYNTGRRIVENGAALSAMLDEVCAAYPVSVEQLVLVGHSMGGLVSRSAARQASEASAGWLDALTHLFCLGSPHLGAPLAKGVDALTSVLKRIPAAGATVPAAILDVRSEGIRDLREGAIDWFDERVVDAPLDGVHTCAIGGTVSRDPDHPAGVLLGDLLVRTGSATGGKPDDPKPVTFDSTEVFPGMNHLQLANHPAVYAILERTLG